jgi:hypothetical protein
MKFFNPTNCIGFAESHSTKLKAKAAITGIRVNIKNPKKFGSKKEYAIKLFLILLLLLLFLFSFLSCNVVSNAFSTRFFV